MASECLGARTRILARVVTGLYEDALRPHGLKLSQVNVLIATASLGSARPAQLCQALVMDSSSLSRTAERMCKRGWLAAGGAPDGDARGLAYQVTPAGHELLDALWPAWLAAQRAAKKELGQEGVGALERFAPRSPEGA